MEPEVIESVQQGVGVNSPGFFQRTINTRVKIQQSTQRLKFGTRNKEKQTS